MFEKCVYVKEEVLIAYVPVSTEKRAAREI